MDTCHASGYRIPLEFSKMDFHWADQMTEDIQNSRQDMRDTFKGEQIYKKFFWKHRD
jgi:hypothetical protein